MIVHAGSIRERPFARTIYAIAARRTTGTLVVTAAGRRHTLRWVDGAVADAESPLANDHVSRVALAAGLINSTIARLCFALHGQRPDDDEIEILAEIGHLSDDRLAALRRLVRRHRAARLFALPEATFELHDGAAASLEADEPLDARALIYHGLHQHYDEARLERESALLADKRFGLAVDGYGSLPHFGFTDRELPILEALRDRVLGPDELVELTRHDRRAVLTVVYALAACDCLAISGSPLQASSSTTASSTPSTHPVEHAAPVTPLPTPPRATPIGTMRPSSPAAAAAPPRPALAPIVALGSGPIADPDSAAVRARRPAASTGAVAAAAAEDVRRLVREGLVGIEASHYVLLGVPPTASAAQLRARCFSLSKQLDPELLATLGLETLADDARRLRLAIDQAFAVLTAPVERSRYDALLAASDLAARPTGEPAADDAAPGDPDGGPGRAGG